MSTLGSDPSALSNVLRITAETAASPSGGDDDNNDKLIDILSEVISNLLLFALIFGMSATVDFKDMRSQLRNKFAILTGVGMQFVIMPFLGYITVKILGNHGLTTAMGITLLIVTSSPGGSYSNWWCSMFNADLALSVTMTALSTLLSTIFLPANLVLYAHAAYGADHVLKNVDFAKLFISLAIVISAITLGLFASYKARDNKRFHKIANRMGSLCGVTLVIFSFLISTRSKEKDAKLWGQDWSFYVGVTMPCLLGLVIANLLSFLIRGRRERLTKPEVVTISVECCYQNVGIATSAAIAMFDDPTIRGQAVCVPLFYGVMEAIVLGIYCVVAWKLGWTKAPSNENICVVIGKSYEIQEDKNELPQHQPQDDTLKKEDPPQCIESVKSPLSLFRRKSSKATKEALNQDDGDESQTNAAGGTANRSRLHSNSTTVVTSSSEETNVKTKDVC